MTLIFVDANVFLNIYKRGFGVRRKKGGDVLSLGDVLDLIGDRVLLPAVTHNEIVRNRCGALPPKPAMQSIHSLHHLTGKLEEFQTKFKALKSDLNASFSQAHEAVRLGTDPISQ